MVWHSARASMCGRNWPAGGECRLARASKGWSVTRSYRAAWRSPMPALPANMAAIAEKIADEARVLKCQLVRAAIFADFRLGEWCCTGVIPLH